MTSARKDLIAGMADSLRGVCANATEADAIRLLAMTSKFRLGDIAMLAEEALHEARRRASAAREHHQ